VYIKPSAMSTSLKAAISFFFFSSSYFPSYISNNMGSMLNLFLLELDLSPPELVGTRSVRTVGMLRAS
jgi:hypothetical protein